MILTGGESADLAPLMAARSQVNQSAESLGVKAARCEVALDRKTYERFGE